MTIKLLDVVDDYGSAGWKAERLIDAVAELSEWSTDDEAIPLYLAVANVYALLEIAASLNPEAKA